MKSFACTRIRLGVCVRHCFCRPFGKAVDNWRFTDAEDSFIRKYKGLTSACSLFLVAIGIVCIQLIIPIEWLILRPPSASGLKTQQLFTTGCGAIRTIVRQIYGDVHGVCNVHRPADWHIRRVAWDSDSNYYESRWILVSAVCTAGCFLVWMIVTTNAGPPYRDPAIALANFFNATAILVFMTIRKLP